MSALTKITDAWFGIRLVFTYNAAVLNLCIFISISSKYSQISVLFVIIANDM